MKEYIKKGFGITVGFYLGHAVVYAILKTINEAIPEPKKEEVNQSEVSTETEES